MELVLKRAAARAGAAGGARRAVTWPVAAVVTGWALVVAAGHLLGAALDARDPLVHISAAPLVGAFDLRWSARR